MYGLSRILMRLFARALFRVRAVGLDRIPAAGPVLICSNHVSNWYPPVLGCLIERKLTFMAKEELFRFAPLAALLRAYGAFPVRRGTGDRGALRTALQILGEARVLVMFPQGHRQSGGAALQLERGAGFIAARSKAAVVPAVITGPYRLFRPVTVFFGEPFYLAGETADAASATAAIADHLQELAKAARERT